MSSLSAAGAMTSIDAGDGRCRHCGTPLTRGVAFVSGVAGCGEVKLPAQCPSTECQAARDAAALADAVARGVIDP